MRHAIATDLDHVAETRAVPSSGRERAAEELRIITTTPGGVVADGRVARRDPPLARVERVALGAQEIDEHRDALGCARRRRGGGRAVAAAEVAGKAAPHARREARAAADAEARGRAVVALQHERERVARVVGDGEPVRRERVLVRSTGAVPWTASRVTTTTTTTAACRTLVRHRRRVDMEPWRGANHATPSRGALDADETTTS